jgi:hypothetical protein
MRAHLLAPTVGSRISAAHLPQGRCRTPRYVLFLPFETTTWGGMPEGIMGTGFGLFSSGFFSLEFCGGNEGSSQRVASRDRAGTQRIHTVRSSLLTEFTAGLEV